MEATKQIQGNTTAAQSCCAAPAAKAGWLSSRNVVIGATALGIAAGLFFGWNWLVAAGLASIIVGILPCLAMCALGLCMNKMGKKEAPGNISPVPSNDVQSPQKPVA